MNEFNIAGRQIGDTHLPLIIAEIGINHEGSLKTAIEMAAAACRACVLYLSTIAIKPATASTNPNPLGISAVVLERPVRNQLNKPSMISAEANPIVFFAIVTSVSGAPQRYSHFNCEPLRGWARPFGSTYSEN